MKWLLSLILVLLAVGTCRVVGCAFYCGKDSDCNDSNECTRDFCRSDRSVHTTYDPSCLADDGWSYWCEHEDVEGGTPCKVELDDPGGPPAEIGVCESGVCRLEEEEPNGDV